MLVISFYRSGHQEVFCKKDVLENFAKFTGKHLWQKCFPVNFAKFSWATFFYKTLLAADSVSTASHVNFLAPKDFLSALYWFQNFSMSEHTSNSYIIGNLIRRLWQWSKRKESLLSEFNFMSWVSNKLQSFLAIISVTYSREIVTLLGYFWTYL